MRAIVSAPLARSKGEGDQLWLLLALAFPAVFINLGQAHNGFLTAALIGAALTPARPPADPRRRPDRLPRLQAAIRPADSAGADRKRTLARLRRRRRDGGAAGARRHVRIRHRCVERVPRLHQIHPHRRARAGRHRLVQNPERVLLGAHVGRRRRARLCGARRGHARGRRRARLAVAQPGRLSAQGRRPADRQRCWRRPTASTTT